MHHVQVREPGSEHELRHLAVRDLLRADSDEAAPYAALKREAARVDRGQGRLSERARSARAGMGSRAWLTSVSQSMRRLVLTLSLLVALTAPTAAASYRPMKGVAAPGPAKYDRVWLQKLGSRGAHNVLVLVPGFFGGAGGITPVARDIVRRVPDLAVWIVDRREQAFEDTSMFEQGDPRAAEDYYLGFRYRRVLDKDVPFVGRWGLKVHLGDLRRVVTAARAGGRRRVILGGHSLGASTTVAYAAWDFGGRAGYRDIDGMVLIDGGLRGSFDSAGLARAERILAQIRAGEVFDDLIGFGVPEIAGVFAQVGALWAATEPDAPSSLYQNPLIPPEFKAPVLTTNEATLAYAFDKDTSPASLGLMHIRAGRLSDSGEPRPWEDGELTPIGRFARTYAANRPNALQWYFPRRLRLDVDAMSPLRETAATRKLRLRPFHAKEIDVPLYAYGADLTRGRVERGARLLARQSRLERPVIVSDRNASHLDPLSAAPDSNRFLETVVPFLRQVVR
ncbi:MAG TPA: GrpB family protein [Thermoleophilaceae bacterium]|nr:GrpB family protein [Thermoleophilaceae bacterium]